MDKLKDFFKKPKHLYFSVMLMCVLVIGLASVSFSYVEESSNNTKQTELIDIDTRISSDELRDGKITLQGNEARTFILSVMSNNNFDSAYELHYESDEEFAFVITPEPKREIGAYDVHQMEVTVSNFRPYPVEITIGLDTAYDIKDIVRTKREIVKE